MAEEEPELDPSLSERDLLFRIARDMRTIRIQLGKVVFAIGEAESEVPEHMRRFMNYMHDVHDVKFMYEELGHPVPEHINEELRRLDDRYRQLLKKLHTGGGAFEKIRREMAEDPKNRWDHAALLTHHKEDQ